LLKSGLLSKIANNNNQIKDKDFITIVLLENLTPDTNTDSTGSPSVLHDVQGALTAVLFAKKEDGYPEVRLLLANGASTSAGNYWPDAVELIQRYSRSEHIVAVTGIGGSTAETRSAVAELAKAGIATVGSVITADNMNQNDAGEPLQNAYRVAPTNTEEVLGAAQYIEKYKLHNIMLVEDTNTNDSYSSTLAKAFRKKFTIPDRDIIYYESPTVELVGTNRRAEIAKRFNQLPRGWLCVAKPDLIYFAGRGLDLAAFFDSVDVSCGLKQVTTVLTGDDASELAGPGHDLKYPDIVKEVAYTGLATSDEWPPGERCREFQEYRNFLQTFEANKFDDLKNIDDGEAIMNYDAARIAIEAARMSDGTGANPSLVSSFLDTFNANPWPGASGEIAFKDGNPVNKPMPVIGIDQDGGLHRKEMVRPNGGPLCTRS
jgi:hypothetical protein